MSDSSWVLRGVDPATRDKAVEEAARLGVSLSDYLTDVVLKTALAEQVASSEADTPATEPPLGDYAARHRLKALERRVETAVTGIDGAMFDLNDRVGDIEALAADTAQGLRQALQETAGQIAAVHLYVADVEQNATARAETGEAAHERLKDVCIGLNQRIDDVETVARRADANTGVLRDAHEALKHAIADDFSVFAQDTADRLNQGLREVRAAADIAAEQADAAVAHLIVELRSVRESLEASVAEGVEETRARMHAAFADAASRMGALTDRIAESERISARSAEQLRAQIVDVEDGAQVALEETAEQLRKVDAALGADLLRAQQDARANLIATRAEIGLEIEAVRDEHATLAGRLKLMDVAVGAHADDIAAIREGVARDITSATIETNRAIAVAQTDTRNALNTQQTLWDQRFDAVIARIADAERGDSEIRQFVRAESDRVESCTFAALEKLSRDIAQGDAALEEKLGETLNAARRSANAAHQQMEAALAEFRAEARDSIEQLQQKLGASGSEGTEQHAGVVARLRLIESALVDAGGAVNPLRERLSAVEAALTDRSLENRISNLERAAKSAESEGAVTVLRQHVDALAAIVSNRNDDGALTQRFDDLRARLSGAEAKAGEAQERLHDVARAANDAANKADVRISRLERFVTVAEGAQAAAARAETKLAQLEQSAAPANTEEMTSMAERLDAMERQQAQSFETLRLDIMRFIEDNDRRLEVLETGPEAVTSDLAAQFADVRRRIEERILGVELRSVRTLEQVADTVAILEQRFSGLADDAEAKTA